MHAAPKATKPAEDADGRLVATYRIASEARSIEARARVLAVEQSVEMPVEAISDARVLREIVGEVAGIEPDGPAHFRVRVRLAVETTGFEASQLLNMAFGNSSLHPEVELTGLQLPAHLVAAFPGPRFGLEGIRAGVAAGPRALTCTALKPQGLPDEELAQLAATFARAGVDVIKDDHGLANQSFSPFARRVPLVQRAIARANRETGGHAVYAPTLSGPPGALAKQARIARDEGVGMVLIAPMLCGIPAFVELVTDRLEVPVLAHPAFAGAQRIAPPLLLGKLFRMFGADATIFPNHGGRFGYSQEVCGAIARCARQPFESLKPTVPVPAGGMNAQRIPEMSGFYGPDTMFLVGGALLGTKEGVFEKAREFVRTVHAAGTEGAMVP